MRQIYLDLDGVMADFDAHFIATFQSHHKTMEEDEMWDYIFSYPTFFRDLPLMEGAEKFFRDIYKYKPIILTACPKADYKNAATCKRNWVREHLSVDTMVLPVLGGKNKCLFMHKNGDILIDDFAKNIKAWNNHGGYGIHHVNFGETQRQLESLL